MTEAEALAVSDGFTNQLALLSTWTWAGVSFEAWEAACDWVCDGHAAAWADLEALELKEAA